MSRLVAGVLAERDDAFVVIFVHLALPHQFVILEAHLLVVLLNLTKFLLLLRILFLKILSDLDHSLHLTLQNLHIVRLGFVALLQLDRLVFVKMKKALILSVYKTKQGGLLDV